MISARMTMLVWGIFELVRGECGSGCLKCSPIGACQLCDTTSNFYLSAGVCLKSLVTNCDSLGLSGRCLSCATGFFFNEDAGNCQSVPMTARVSNCERYGSDKGCRRCAAGHFLDGLRCSRVLNVIEGCVVHLASGKCSICETGKVLTADGAACLEPPVVDGCAGFSTLNCVGCRTEAFRNPSLWLFGSFGLDGLAAYSDSQLNPLRAELNREMTVKGWGVCQSALSVPHCAEFNAYDACGSCKEGYFLAGPRACVKEPDSALLGCDIYASSTRCSSCRSGYYLNGFGMCEPITAVPFCRRYSSTALSTLCEQCLESHFLGSENLCVRRTASRDIQGCRRLFDARDACADCGPGQFPTSDGLACLRALPNCAAYLPSTRESTSLACAVCNAGYFLSGGVCRPGPVEGCAAYAGTPPACVACARGRYFVGGVCSLQTKQTGCAAESMWLPGVCDACEGGRLPFLRVGNCAAVVPVANCAVYSSVEACGTCMPGFALSLGVCVPIDGELNCLTLDAALKSCTKCRVGFVLESGRCVRAFAMILDNCGRYNISGIQTASSIRCEACGVGAIPLNFDNLPLCYETDVLAMLVPTTNAISIDFTACRTLRNSTASGFTCSVCRGGYWLTPDGKCISQCDSSVNTTTLFSLSSPNELGFYSLANINYCEVASTGCALISPASPPQPTGLCGGCRPGYVSTVQSAVSATQAVLIDIHSPKTDVSGGPPPVNLIPAVTCVKTTDMVYKTADIENCKYYYLLNQSNTYGCLRCRRGYRGVVKSEGTEYGQVTRCDAWSNCLTDVELHGLPVRLNHVLSCHACQDPLTVPHVFLGLSSSLSDIRLTLKGFNISEAFPKTGTGVQNSYSIECLAPGSIVGATNQTPDPNCAIHIVNVEASSGSSLHSTRLTGLDRTKVAVFCGACKPGYIPLPGKDSLGVSPQLLVASCVAIDGCVGFDWANSCSSCPAGYAYVPATGVNYTKCATNSRDTQCFAFDESAGKCRFCVAGFTLNADGLCEALLPPRCSGLDPIRPFTMITDFALFDLPMVLFMSPGGRGCATCQSGFTAWESAPRGRPVCTLSSYVGQNVFLAGSAFVADCLAHGKGPGGFLCDECRPGFVLQRGKKKCLNSANLADCREAIDESRCGKCGDGFVVVEGRCEAASLPKCVEFDYDEWSTRQTCVRCEAGYFMFAGECRVGNVENCRRLGWSADTCVECEAGYVLASSSGGSALCFPLDPALRCAGVDSKALETGSLDCVRCSSATFSPVPAESLRSDCLQVPSVPNCLEYELGPTLAQSSLNCIACADGFYVDGGRCRLRSLRPANCAKLATYADACETCAPRNYLAEGGKTCRPFPDGIPGCVRYLSVSLCVTCAPGYYLANGACEGVSAESAVAGCKVYRDALTCSGCQTGLYLSNNACLADPVAGCATFAAPGVCLTCPEGKGLYQPSLGLTYCITISQPNCLKTTLTSPFPCLICQPGFYSNPSGVCVAGADIPGCETLDGPTTCSRCRAELALSSTKTSCLDLGDVIEPFCVDSRIESSPICITCKGGFLMNSNGECKACSATGCYFCDPRDPNVCLMCRPGFFMPKAGTCKSETQTSANSETPKQISPESLTHSSIILSALLIFIAVMI